MSDGNTHAIAQHLADQEEWDELQEVTAALEQAQDGIAELEAKLAEYKHVTSAIDTQWAESQDEIADLKAKLAKAVECVAWCAIYEESEVARTILAELKGEANDA